jgi:hypothetical protein
MALSQGEDKDPRVSQRHCVLSTCLEVSKFQSREMGNEYEAQCTTRIGGNKKSGQKIDTARCKLKSLATMKWVRIIIYFLINGSQP